MTAHPAHAAGVAAYRQLEADAWDEAGEDAAACTCEDCVVRVILEAAAPLIIREALTHPVAADLRAALEAGDPLEPPPPARVLELVRDTPPD